MSRTSDQLYVQGVNDYVLTIQGTVIKSNYLPQPLKLELGVYRLQQEVQCMFCTWEIFTPNTAIHHGQVLEHLKWNIYNVSNCFSELTSHKLGGLITGPHYLPEMTLYNLDQSMYDVPNDIKWSYTNPSILAHIV